MGDFRNQNIRRIQPAGTFVIDPERLSLSQVLGSASREDITISASDDEAHDFSASVNAPWLKVTPAIGTIPARGSVTLTVETAATLAKGLYATNMSISDLATRLSVPVPVSVAVSGSAQQLRLGQAGLSFSALQDGPVPPAQAIPVLNVGTGAMNWTASTSALAGGDWLTVTPVSGSTPTPASPPNVQVSVKTAGLAPGAYFGLVTIRSPQADNAPQSAVVVLNVVPANTPPIAQVNPQGLIVTAPPDRAPVAPTVAISNISTRQITYTSTLTFADRRNWFTLSPATGNIPAGESRNVQIIPAIGGIPVGQYRGQIAFRITPDNVTRTVDLILVVHPLATAAPDKGGPLHADGCVPDRISTLFRTPGPSFATTAGWPTAVEVQAVDNCGKPITDGRVTVSFSTNDPLLPLQSVGDGRWSGAWTARTARATGVQLTARVENNAPRLSATTQITGGVGTNPEQPLINREGVLNLMTQKKETPLAVGSLVSVLGTRLAAESNSAEASKPLPVLLGDTRAFVAGQPLPLRESSPGRLDAFLPLGIAENTRHQVIVQSGRSYSPPEEVLITSSSPLVLTRENFGTSVPLIYKVMPEGSPVLVEASRPAKVGDVLQILCAGLGPIRGSVPPGEAAPAGSRLAVAGTVKVEIEDLEAEVTEAILAPGELGVYRVTVKVPEGVANTVSARVIVSVNGVESSLVTIPVAGPATE